MKKIPNLIVVFLFLIASGQSIAASVTLGPGSEVTTGRIVSSQWLNYQITNDRFIGYLEIRVRLVRASFMSMSNYAAPYTLPAQGSSIEIIACPSYDGGSSYQCVHVPLAVSCNSADNGDINSCMNRIIGTEETVIVPIDEPRSQMTATRFCMRDYLYFPEVRRTVVAGGTTGSLDLYFDPYTICGVDEGAPPPIPELTGSVCSLNSQNLNLGYSSTSLNVDGLTQSTNLNVTCTAGNAQNYELKLTGPNVTNGRLDFNNGVSAQVSLNGTQVQANGTGIPLNSLTSQTIPVSATLTGTAATSGPSNASGILVLEAQ